MSRRAAAPKYVQRALDANSGEALKSLPPGHQFGPYLSLWSKEDKWSISDDAKGLTLKEIADSSKGADWEGLKALQTRQQHLIETSILEKLRLTATSVSPFMTGLGNEHPVENGFTFMQPHGVPYLPGASAKGVIRHAAELMSVGEFGDNNGWNPLLVWYLFGFDHTSAMLTGSTCLPEKAQKDLVEEAESLQELYLAWANAWNGDDKPISLLIENCCSKEQSRKYRNDTRGFLVDLTSKSDVLRKSIHLKGALNFWDVYPTPSSKGALIDVEIFTPHHAKYLRGEGTPHDSEQPVPISVLSVSQGCQFEFIIECDRRHLTSSSECNWKSLVLGASDAAFDWLGFGAKSALGYGHMVLDESIKEELDNQRDEASDSASGVGRVIREILKDVPDDQHDSKILEAIKQGKWDGSEKIEAAIYVREIMIEMKKWMPDTEGTSKKKKKLKERSLEVQRYIEGD